MFKTFRKKSTFFVVFFKKKFCSLKIPLKIKIINKSRSINQIIVISDLKVKCLTLFGEFTSRAIEWRLKFGNRSSSLGNLGGGGGAIHPNQDVLPARPHRGEG